jgi:hypothetical protein
VRNGAELDQLRMELAKIEDRKKEAEEYDESIPVSMFLRGEGMETYFNINITFFSFTFLYSLFV